MPDMGPTPYICYETLFMRWTGFIFSNVMQEKNKINCGRNKSLWVGDDALHLVGFLTRRFIFEVGAFGSRFGDF